MGFDQLLIVLLRIHSRVAFRKAVIPMGTRHDTCTMNLMNVYPFNHLHVFHTPERWPKISHVE